MGPSRLTWPRSAGRWQLTPQRRSSPSTLVRNCRCGTPCSRSWIGRWTGPVPGRAQCCDRAGNVVADINDRLERLRRREEFATRAHPRPVVDAPTGGRGDDFTEVLDAVARAVLRHPGLSVLVTAGDSGRRGRTVVRVTERDGSVETAVVAPRAAQAAEPRNSGRHA